MRTVAFPFAASRGHKHGHDSKQGPLMHNSHHTRGVVAASPRIPGSMSGFPPVG